MIPHHKKLLIHKIVRSFRWVHTFLRISPKACFWLWSTFGQLYMWCNLFGHKIFVVFTHFITYCCCCCFISRLFYCFLFLSLKVSPKVYLKKIFNSYLIFHHKNIEIKSMKEKLLFIKWCVWKLALNQDYDNVFVWNEISFGMK